MSLLTTPSMFVFIFRHMFRFRCLVELQRGFFYRARSYCDTLRNIFLISKALSERPMTFTSNAKQWVKAFIPITPLRSVGNRYQTTISEKKNQIGYQSCFLCSALTLFERLLPLCWVLGMLWLVNEVYLESNSQASRYMYLHISLSHISFARRNEDLNTFSSSIRIRIL